MYCYLFIHWISCLIVIANMLLLQDVAEISTWCTLFYHIEGNGKLLFNMNFHTPFLIHCVKLKKREYLKCLDLFWALLSMYCFFPNTKIKEAARGLIVYYFGYCSVTACFSPNTFCCLKRWKKTYMVLYQSLMWHNTLLYCFFSPTFSASAQQEVEYTV